MRDFFRGHLRAHFCAEEQVLFPRMRALIPESGAVIDELLQDHQKIGQAVSQLEAGTSGAKLIFDLGDLLERHIRKEERELFPLYERHVEKIDAAKIGQDIARILQTPSVD
jgi:iron-sulfur cluster repair protein YtfE (RIC family)